MAVGSMSCLSESVVIPQTLIEGKRTSTRIALRESLSVGFFITIDDLSPNLSFQPFLPGVKQICVEPPGSTEVESDAARQRF